MDALQETKSPREIAEAMCAPCDATTYQGLGVLAARLIRDAEPEDWVARAVAVIGEGRYAEMMRAEGSVVRGVAQKAAADLTEDDARSYSCLHAAWGVAMSRGHRALEETDPRLVFALALLPDLIESEPMGQSTQGSPELPVRMAELLIGLAADPDEEPIIVSAATLALMHCGSWDAPAQQKLVVQRMWDMGWFGRTVSKLRALELEDLLSVQPGADFYPASAFLIVGTHLSRFFGSDLETTVRAFIVNSGLFQLCCDVVTEFARRPEGTVSVTVVYFGVRMLMFAAREPGCDETLRSMARALAFCTTSSELYSKYIGATIAMVSCNVAAAVFGRDEEPGELVFSQSNVDELVSNWSAVIAGTAYGKILPPTADYIQALEMCTY